MIPPSLLTSSTSTVSISNINQDSTTTISSTFSKSTSDTKTPISRPPAIQSDSPDPRETSADPSPVHHLDFGALLTPVPSVALDASPRAASYQSHSSSCDPPLSPPRTDSPTPSIVEKKLRRRSRIPSLLLRFASSPVSNKSDKSDGSLSRSLRRRSLATFFASPDPSPGHGGTASLPRDNSGDQDARSGNVLFRQSCNPLHVAQSRTSSRPPSVISLAPTRRASIVRGLVDVPSYLPEHRLPEIFTSTASCRLSVPITALRHLESISEQDISRKMHQTSSRLLRMTEDERPYTRDFKDLFSTLMVSLPLTPHRVRFQKVDHTFTSEEAITNLGSLKFSQSNRMPDPKDPSRIVTTTTTTTFSMAREMAKSVCQKFLEARFVESVDGKNDFSSKNAVWQLTPKGMHILQRFCNRNGINQRHVQLLLESPRNTMHLVLLEREADGDRIYRDPATIEVVFRRFVGQEGPNLKWSTANSDSDSVTDYQTGLVGVKMARERKVADKTYWNTFTGKAAVDWLMDCCTMVDRRETIELAGLFVEFGLIHPVEGTVGHGKFSPQKASIYYVTDKGQRVAGWIPSPRTAINGTEPQPPTRRIEGGRDSNANRMTVIIRDPALRLLFREFLRDTHCEENLAFYLDVQEFLANYHNAKRASSQLRLDTIRETLAAAYSLYNAFLAPGSPCELNIDHSLRTALAARMTRAVGDDEATIASLDEVANLFDQAQTSVFKLMASDSVPKFMREPKYAPVIRERNLDITLGTHLAGRSAG